MSKAASLMYVLVPVGASVSTGTPQRQAPLAAAPVNGGEQGILLVANTVLNGGGGGFPVSIIGLDDNADNVAPLDGLTNPLFEGVVNRNTVYSTADDSWWRMRMVVDDSDAIAAGDPGLVGTVAKLSAYNQGTSSWDRLRVNSASMISEAVQPQSLQVANPGEWAVNDAPAVGVRASATKAAGGAGVRHVCRSISGAFRNLVGATESGELVVRDGATGVGTILWRCRWINGVSPVQPGNVNIVGSENTAMTIEFVAAPTNAGNDQCVAMTGYSVS